jgi:ER-bound oxygenase mpaB/B'/Rubber oxygenase, catalytic domain
MRFRDEDVDDLLHLPLTGQADSLYSIIATADADLMNVIKDLYGQSRSSEKKKHGTEYRSAESAFKWIEGTWSAIRFSSGISFDRSWGTTFSDGRITRLLYSDDTSAQKMAAVVECDSADAFLRRFRAARSNAYSVFLTGRSVNVLNDLSFVETYNHPDIADLFRARKFMTNEKVVMDRVSETARIMMRILFGNINNPSSFIYDTRLMASTLMLAHLHNTGMGHYKHKQDNYPLYNQGSVAFTLLTFSYLVAREWEDSNEEWPKADWYYIWKIVGSLLGLSGKLIPNGHREASQLWNEFTRKGSPYYKVLGDSDPLIVAYKKYIEALGFGAAIYQYGAWLGQVARVAGGWYFGGKK